MKSEMWTLECELSLENKIKKNLNPPSLKLVVNSVYTDWNNYFREK